MTTKRPLSACLMVGFVALLFITPSALRAEEKSPDWVGAWIVYICPGSSDPCSTDSPIINLASFTKDGITIGGDYGLPAASPGIGGWVKTGHNRIATTFVELLSDSQGALSSRSKVRGNIKYDPKSDTLSGPFSVDITDPSGQNALDHFEGTALLTRIQVEPLP